MILEYKAIPSWAERKEGSVKIHESGYKPKQDFKWNLKLMSSKKKKKPSGGNMENDQVFSTDYKREYNWKSSAIEQV